MMKGRKMKPWTTQFVTCLWASGGFDGIAELHNRELGKQLKGQMNNDSEEAEHHIVKTYPLTDLPSAAELAGLSEQRSR
jgi:hypothetical protein